MPTNRVRLVWVAGAATIFAVAVPSRATAQAAPLDTVELGFGIGPLPAVGRYADALRTVQRDGFRIIRAYEPFRASDHGFDRVLADLGVIDSLGLVPYVGLSNFPYDLAPSADVMAAAPGPRRLQMRRRQMFAATNRYPPNPDRYGAMLDDFLSALAARFGRPKLETWYFEIGNEPDAPVFFWGQPQDFRTLIQVAIARFHAFDPNLRIGGGAFTSGLVAHGTDKSADYVAVAQSLGSDATAFVSAHIYAPSFPDATQIAPDLNRLFGPPGSQLRVVSEWNVDTKPTPNAHAIFMSTDAVVPYLIDMMAGAAEAGVRIVLVHKLMDDPAHEQLGYFDGSGKPKPAYAMVAMAGAFARQGFRVTHPDGGTLLAGDSLTYIHAGAQPVPFDPSRYSVVAPQGFQGSAVAPGAWAILRGQP